MTRQGYFLRLALSVAIDALDFTIGRVPIFGSGFDLVSAGAQFLLWGPVGLAGLWEVLDITDQFDGFIPTATLTGLYIGWREGFLFRGPSRDVTPNPR